MEQKRYARNGYGMERYGRPQTYSANMLARRRRIRRRIRIRKGLGILAIIFTLYAFFSAAGKPHILWDGRTPEIRRLLEEAGKPGDMYPQELLEMLEKNPETYSFVAGYPERDIYLGKEIDLSGEYTPGQAPLLMQWDPRWGYDSYGDDMVAVAGCGPTCMTMAYLYLTGDTSMNPRKMAEYAFSQGYCTDVGTSWGFFTEGASGLGCSGNELPLSETAMKGALDEGGVIICSMRPGDFTTTGHFIVLRGYGEDGFYVNDPNSRENSKKTWDYDTLSGQIKCLWKIGK